MPVVIKWNPANNIFSLEDAISQMLDQVSEHMAGRKTEKSSAWVPVADMYETDANIIIDIELAEIDKNSLEILYEEGYLLVRGERPFSSEMQSGRIHRIERMYGAFQRAFWIPTSVDSRMISATYDRGVLRIMLTKVKTDHVKVPITFK
jgi:HSP20 family protein